MKYNFFSRILGSALIGLSAFALVSCGNDNDEPDNPGKPDTPDIAADATLVGVWDGYVEQEKLGVCLLTATINEDNTGNFVWRDTYDGSVKKKENIKWSATKTQFKLYFTDGGDVTDVDVCTITRLDSEIVLLVNGDNDLMAFIKKDAQKKVTKDMLVGTWLYDYQWSESRQMWRYDEVSFRKNGDGTYIENAYRLQFGGSVDEFEIKWTLSGRELSMTYRNGEYGYKPGEPEYETETGTIVMASSDMMWACEEDEYILMLRK